MYEVHCDFCRFMSDQNNYVRFLGVCHLSQIKLPLGHSLIMSVFADIRSPSRCAVSGSGVRRVKRGVILFM